MPTASELSRGCWWGPHSVGLRLPQPLGAGSCSLPTGLWRRTEQVPFPVKLRTHTTSLAGFQKAARYCGNKKALPVEEKKTKRKKKTSCLLLYHIHSSTHPTDSIPLAGHPVSSSLLKKNPIPKPEKKLDSFTSNA